MARLLRNTSLFTRSLFVPKDGWVTGVRGRLPEKWQDRMEISAWDGGCVTLWTRGRMRRESRRGPIRWLSRKRRVKKREEGEETWRKKRVWKEWEKNRTQEWRRRRFKSDGSDSGEENMSKKELALQQALDQITSAFGKGSIMWLGRSFSPKNVPVVSTGSFALDIALGIGGLPKGRVVEIYGPEASGKTTLALHVIAEAQKQGGYCVFVDAEHALDKTLAESIGVNTINLLLSQPDCGEQALSLVDTLIRSGSVDVIVVDSVAALVPKGELDGEMGDAHMAMQARLMSQALRKLSHALSLSQSILIFINQVRSKISTFGGFSGPTEVTCGGNALKFYASVRLNIKRIGFVKKGEEILGSQILVKVVKNKLAPPFKTAEFELQFGKGICKETEIIDLGVKHKLILKAGAMFYYNEQSFRGKDALKSFLAENRSVLEELEMKLREKLLNAETEKTQESDVINGDVTEETATVDSINGNVTKEITTVDSTDEEAAAIVEA